MTRITVLDPTAPPPDLDPDPGPDAGPIEGKVIGIRFDRTWKSFLWAMDEWSHELNKAGAQVRTWCAGNRIGDDGIRTADELEAFSGEVDLALLGLGN